MSEKTVALILAFLHTKQTKIFGNVQTSRHEGHLPYVCITCNYSGNDLDICVYNDSFIKVKVDNYPWTICDGIKSLRDSIYKLEYHNHGYRSL